MDVKTKRLYSEDPYRVDFVANVSAKKRHGQHTALVLDRTCFYPESGGQPADRGTLDGIKVLDVVEENGLILHVLERDTDSQRVEGRIEWERRLDHMQQHAGQHILSQAFYELYQAETKSFHLGKEVSTVEIGVRKVSDRQIDHVEKRANHIVFDNRPIKTYEVPEEKIGDIPLRRPPQKNGLIRVVEVGEYDYSACGGTHPRSTGEVGLIKILKWEKIRDNVRFEFVCGGRALEDYSMKNRIIREIAVRFNVAEADVESSVDKLFSDLKSQKKVQKDLRTRLLDYEALEIISHSQGKMIRNVFADKTPEEVKLLALNIIRKGDFVVLFGLRLENRTLLVLACSESLDLDLRELISVVSPVVAGKGGGSRSFVEIGGQAGADLDAALGAASEFIHKHLKLDHS